MASRWKQDFPIPYVEDSYVTRREFTKFLGLTSLAFLAGTFAAAGRKLIKQFFPEQTSSIPIAGIDEVPVGGYKLFRYPTENDPCILVRLAEHKFVAFDQRCTHLSCPVYLDAETGRLACPCHAGFFSAQDGRPLAGPPKRPLTQLEVTTRNAQVLVGPTVGAAYNRESELL
jgi:Rieske Fe-S protein